MIDRRLLAEPAVRLSVAASVVIGLVSTAAVVVQALALADVLAAAMRSRFVDAFPALAWLVAAFGVKAACAVAGELAAAAGAETAKSRLRSRLLEATLRHAVTGAASAGRIAAIAGRGTDGLDPYIGRYLPDVVLAFAAPVALTIVVGGLDWVSAAVIATVLLLFPLFGYLVGATSGALAERRWRQVEAFGAQVADVFEGMPILKAMGHSARQRLRIAAAGDALSRASLATLRVAFLSGLVLDTLASVSVALVAVPLGLRLLSGSVTLSSALAVLVIAPEVFLPLRRASAEFHQSTEGLVASASALEVIGSCHAEASPQTVAAPPDPRLVPVALCDVHVTLDGRQEPVLHGASLVIEPGEHVVLVGANGAGKTTAIATLLGFVVPSLGAVTIGGKDLRELDLDRWRACLGYVPEHPALIPASLAANLRIASEHANEHELVTALRDAGAGHLAGLLHERVGDGGRPVSAGERQRIALARAMLRDASFYVLDEPTAHLDDDTETKVVEALRARLRGRSALIVTHRPAALRLADRVVALEGGRFHIGGRAAVPA